MKKTLTIVSVSIAFAFALSACGKEEPKYEMNKLSQLSNNRGVGGDPGYDDKKAKAIIAADTGKKVRYVCRLIDMFPSASTADERPASVPGLGITYKADYGKRLGVVASTPEIAEKIVEATESLLRWRIKPDTCTIEG
jgi:hypothetical protein